MAVISVVASQPGLPVLINGTPAGVTPLQYLAVPAGEYEIIVRQSRAESWLDADWVEKCRLAPGDSLLVRPQLRRGYLINSIPYGAEVFVEHVYHGATPVVVHVSEDRSVSVEVRMRGYQDFVVTLDSAAQRLWHVTLVEDPEYAAVRRQEQRQRGARRQHFRRLALLAGGASAISGVSAVLLKRRADRFYEDYLTAGELTELNALYKKTSTYDEYAGLAFTIFEVSFGLSFYWFLRSTLE